MLSLLIIAASLASTSQLPSQTEARSIDETKVVQTLEKLGGEVVRDSGRPSKPIISIDLAGTAVSNDDLTCLVGLSELRELSLAHTAITDKGLVNIKGLKTLEQLDLSRTAITGEGIDSLKDLGVLKRLYLARTSINDQGVKGTG